MDSEVQLTLKCMGLRDEDTFSKSDPAAVVYEKDPQHKHWSFVKHTEVIWNNLNPEWVTTIRFNYLAGQLKAVKIQIVDIDDEGADFLEQDFLGETTFCLSEVVPFKGTKRIVKELTSAEGQADGKTRSSRGKIIIYAEVMRKVEGSVKFDVRACNVPKSVFRASKVYYKISKAIEGDFAPVYRSDSFRDENPQWKEMLIPIKKLCNGEGERLLEVAIIHKSGHALNTGRRQVLGCFTTCANQLLESGQLMFRDDKTKMEIHLKVEQVINRRAPK